MMKPAFIAEQGRRPSGVLGLVVARFMAHDTRRENDITLQLLDLEADDDVLEIGYGHGETLSRASEIVYKGRLSGIDFSEVMLAQASFRNRELIRSGQLDLRYGDSRELSFGCERFDKIFSVHTIYFWDDPVEHLEEAYRVMKPGGCIVIGYRSRADRRVMSEFPEPTYRFPSVEEVEVALMDAGFNSVFTKTAQIGKRLTHWTIAGKPAHQTQAHMMSSPCVKIVDL